jgi:hypothetical protein
VSALYCGPRARTGKGRSRQGAGFYPELAALGFDAGDSTALVSRVARQCVLLPSFELARGELKAAGLELDIKAVHRLACRLGGQALTARRHDLLLWRQGVLAAGKELAGKRVGVAIDGGRIRLRRVTRKQKGKASKKKQRRRYRAEWREPKVLIIFEMDEVGRMVKGSRPWIDATFAGPDELMELLAMHLHQLGAAQAKVVSFLCDGAPWIWERLEWVRRRVGLKAKQVVAVLDWCHAVHHVGLALAVVPLEQADRKRVFKKLRKWLKQGRWAAVVEELEDLGRAFALNAKMETEVAFLRKHGERGHLAYARLRRRGLPLGSGAIESAIRRVVNLRLKGAGLMWQEENAEGMLLLRAAALTGRWDETVQWAQQGTLQEGCLDWRWQAPDMSFQLKTPNRIKPPKAQSQMSQADQRIAA